MRKKSKKKYYKMKKMKGYKAYKFHVGQAVMKANPKKLGGRKGDRMTPDWLNGYVVVSLTDHQVVLRNTKTNKVLKSISLAHIKPFRERGADTDVENKVAGVGMAVAEAEVAGGGEEVTCVEVPGVGGGDIACVEFVGGGEEAADVEVPGVGEEVADVEVPGVGEEVADVEVPGVGEEVADVEVPGVGEEVVDDKVAGVGEEVVDDKVACVSEGVVDVEVAEFERSNDQVRGAGNEVKTLASLSFAGEVHHLQQLGIKGIPLSFPYLDFGTAKLTGRDIWSLIPLQEVSTCQFKTLKSEVPDFMPGLLTDMIK
ncbi:uncharacterized protein LOC114532140 [Dendronephthya gigantea]|uniref:uncharacterized protein LOC114532140 n=1 Tax=Dendronephthya gigantea TaxID=151771 RepID=UPI00106AE766|nr:uncharacterized protein LOC114532140 [Dendronephthya gigantea]